ncbi:EF-hand domain-containing protein [Burkholderia plantarii]|uniref:EF-hand domain-containing protein n=1 Tax=Burkholderia plantarii TaxID=41899 RepID=UPI0006D8C977|nr:EF-hand domain-containing protein [Burkholderia plantarii]ALK32926.1 calcium-binding protein [Burkholderia plantarii]WLE61998.1 EF-hand domain-containing protein [Burkholderia plantarii]GLZ20352.1 hypothetical protein Bpla01_38810 [Burkholderia plantarii]
MKRLSIILVALVAASSAYAQSSMQQKLEQRFAAADADHDGKLTLAEAQAGMPRLAAHFDEIDTAHQGYVTLDQIEQFAASRRQ